MKRTKLTTNKYVKRAMSLLLCGALMLGGVSGNAEVRAAEPTTFTETEENDTQNQATNMELNTSYVGNTFSSSDVDWYKFTIPEGANGYFNVTIEPDASADIQKLKYGWKMEIYKKSESDSLLTYTHITSKCVTQKMPFEPGDYFIRILADSSYEWTDEPYSVRVDYTSNPYWEKEYNDSAANANMIEVNKTYYGNMINSKDVDWYEFSVSQYGTFKMKLSPDESEDVTSLRDGWTIQIYRANDASVFEELAGVTSPSSTCDMFLREGKYRVKIFNKSSYEAPIGKTYNLCIDYTAGGNVEQENNDEMSTANEIATDVTYTGNMKYDYEGEDKDYYVFTAPVTGNLTMTFNRDVTSDPGNGYNISILDSSNKEVKKIEKFTSESTSIAGIPVTAGMKYYIYIRNNYFHEQIPGVNYHFSLGITPTVVTTPTPAPGKTSTPTQNLTATNSITKTKVSVTSVKAKKKNVQIKWKKNAFASGYKIYRSTKKNGKYKCIKTISKVATTSYNDRSVKKGKSYYYKVRAYKKVDQKTYYSSYSVVKRVKIKK